MSSSQPYGGTSSNRLTALINAANGTALREEIDFTYGVPQAVVGPRGENTMVVLTPCVGALYRGPQTVYYNRLSLDILNDLPPEMLQPVLIDTFPFCMQNVLSNIDSALGLSLQPEEVLNVCFDSPAVTYPLTIVPGSLAWLPGTYQFRAISAAYYDLATQPNVLRGFTVQHTDLSTLPATVLGGFVAS